MQTGRPNKSAVFVGLAVGAGSLTVGCEKPESGSLENVKNRPVAVDYAKLDYGKIDYAKLDYGKLDYSKIDYGKLDPKKITPEVVAKIGPEGLAKVATKNVGLVPSDSVSQEMTRRLDNRLKAAEAAGNKELVAEIQKVSEAIRLTASAEFIGEQVLCW